MKQLKLTKIIHEPRLRDINLKAPKILTNLEVYFCFGQTQHPIQPNIPCNFDLDVQEIKKCHILISSLLSSYPIKKIKIKPYLHDVGNRLSKIDISTEFPTESLVTSSL